MNKRIKKKRYKLGDFYIGDLIYTRKELSMINKAHIGYITCVLYEKIKEPKITRPRVKALINYIYKNRMKHCKSNYLSYKHLRFARHLKPKPEYMMSDTSTMPKVLTIGKTMKYHSSTFISMTRSVYNSCEAASMEVD